MDNRHLIYSPINLYFRIHSVQSPPYSIIFFELKICENSPY